METTTIVLSHDSVPSVNTNGRNYLLADVSRRSRRQGNILGYSRFVSAMKLFLPMLALLLIVLIVAWPHLTSQKNRFRLGFTEMRLGTGDDPAMLNPRYIGTDSNSQPYSVTAELAKNLLQAGAPVELEMPKADIALNDGTWLVVTAETGTYGRSAKTLELVGMVNLFHDSGYEFNTSKANIDLDKGIAYGKVPVEGQGPFGELKAQGFRLLNKGKTIYFTGKSHLVLYPTANRQTFKGG